MRVLFAGSPDIAVPSLIRVSFEHEIVGVLTNPESAKGRGLGLEAHARRRGGRDGARRARAYPRARAPGGRGPRGGRRPARPRSWSPTPTAASSGRNSSPSSRREGSTSTRASCRGTAGPRPSPRPSSPATGETAITVQRLALEMDSGDILGQLRLPLSGTETAEDIAEVAAIMGADLLSPGARGDRARAGRRPRPQEGEPSYCSMLQQGGRPHRLDSPLLDIDAKVRAFYPWPGAFTYFRGMQAQRARGLSLSPRHLRRRPEQPRLRGPRSRAPCSA